MKRIFLVLVLTILTTGCATFSFTPNPLPEPTEPTQLITVPPGETFDIVLPSNSSTGYRWDILPELDVNLLELIGQNYIAEQPVMPGSGGVEVWTFRAINPGDTTIALGYFPPSNETDPEETVTFSIHVE